MKKTLIVRYHKLGDAIIVLSLIYDLAMKYPDDKFTVLSSSKLEFLFDFMPDNIEFMLMISKRPHSFLRGLRYTIEKQVLLLKLTFMRFDNVVLLQGESFERRLFKCLNKVKADIIRGEKSDFNAEKRLSINCNDGLTIQGLHINKFAQLGYINLIPKFNPSLLKKSDISGLLKTLNINSQKKLFAIAPFSALKTKTYPLDKMEQIISYFSEKSDNYQLLILGGGSKEKAIVSVWSEKYPSIINLINCISFKEEVSIIAQCSLVLTMDSANLHLASLLDTPVISIWGTTVPKCGYYPQKEDINRAIVKNISCQPCSLWGDRPCYLKEHQYDCMNIAPEIIIKKIEDVINEFN